MYDKALDSYLQALKFFPGLLVRTAMIEKLYGAVF